MKFYQVIEENDPVAGDCFFPSRKQAEAHLKETYEEGEAYIRVLEHKGPLTKAAVCRMLTDWPQR